MLSIVKSAPEPSLKLRDNINDKTHTFIPYVCIPRELISGRDLFETRHEKISLPDFQPGSTQTGLYTRILKFWVYVEEILHYSCSKNKGADQLCSYCIGKNLVFS